MSDTLKLGAFITEPQQRDAVHIAVAPVEAAERLDPGTHVGFVSAGTVGRASPTKIGVIDPFLREAVPRGARVWLFLYPGTITTLRHEWTHPAFQGVAPETGRSALWIQEFAEDMNVTYEEMMEAARDWVRHGHHFSRGGDFEGQQVPDEFWDHYQVVTGTLVPRERKESFFSCAC